ncbi:MAG: RIP metalloprotease RseP [Bacilli bacterium]
MQTILSFLVVIGLLISIHELGHFIFARRAGILVREFAIGFGPKLFTTKPGETRYTLRLLPLGGYVRMAGEDPEIIDIKTGQEIGLLFNSNGHVNKLIIDKKRFQSYSEYIKIGRVEEIDLERKLSVVLEDGDLNKSTYSVDPNAELVYEKQEVQIAPFHRQFAGVKLSHRALTIFAGPLFNFILAVFLFMVVAGMIGVPSDEVLFNQIQTNKPAAAAGLLDGDQAIRVGGVKVTSNTQLINQIRQSPGEQLPLTILRDGKEINLVVIPEIVNEEGMEVGKIGAGVSNKRIENPSLTSIIGHGFTQSWEWTKLIFNGFGQLVTGQVGFNQLSGFVGIAKQTGEVAEQGTAPLVLWTAILSLYLGIFNLLPIPALDGSRLFFIGIEAIRGKPVDPHKESMVHFIGFAFLMLLMVAVTYNDILKLF